MTEDSVLLGAPFEEPSAEHPFVISSSSLSEFVRCRKAYQIQYEWMLEPKIKPAAMEKGSSMHKMLEMLGNILRGKAAPGDLEAFKSDAVYSAFAAFAAKRVIPRHNKLVAEILLVEEPIYLQVFEHVYLRVTMDKIERLKNGTIVGTDYKTFSKADAWDTQLDFQARLYSAILEMKYPGDLCQFEHQKVRTIPPGVPKNETEEKNYEKAQAGTRFLSGPRKGQLYAWESWSEEECYEEILTVYNKRELVIVWEEAQDMVRDLLRARREQRFYRISPGWRSGPGSCASCNQRTVCVSEIEDTLDEQQIELTSNKRAPLVVNPQQLLVTRQGVL